MTGCFEFFLCPNSLTIVLLLKESDIAFSKVCSVGSELVLSQKIALDFPASQNLVVGGPAEGEISILNVLYMNILGKVELTALSREIGYIHKIRNAIFTVLGER